MIQAFTLFFLLIYTLLEMMKYKRVETLRLKSTVRGRLYNEPVVFLKLIILSIDIILLAIICISSAVEKSGGIRGYLMTAIPFALFLAVCIRDITRVIHGHNDKIYEGAEDI